MKPFLKQEESASKIAMSKVSDKKEIVSQAPQVEKVKDLAQELESS